MTQAAIVLGSSPGSTSTSETCRRSIATCSEPRFRGTGCTRNPRRERSSAESAAESSSHGRAPRGTVLMAMPQPESPDESQQGPNIFMPPDEFAGKWANAAAIARTPHEFTLDFLRIGPQGQQGIVVSRVSFSPLLASQLLELLGEQWQAYTEESGIPPEGESDD